MVPPCEFAKERVFVSLGTQWQARAKITDCHHQRARGDAGADNDGGVSRRTRRAVLGRIFQQINQDAFNEAGINVQRDAAAAAVAVGLYQQQGGGQRLHRIPGAGVGAL